MLADVIGMLLPILGVIPTRVSNLNPVGGLPLFRCERASVEEVRFHEQPTFRISRPLQASSILSFLSRQHLFGRPSGLANLIQRSHTIQRCIDAALVEDELEGLVS